MNRYVDRSVGLSVGWSVIVCFFSIFGCLLHYCSCFLTFSLLAFGLLVYWSFGLLVFWTLGLLDYLSFGLWVLWSFSLLVVVRIYIHEI